jgi:hypothetical protein
VVRSGNITIFGIVLGVTLLISAGLAAIFWLPSLLVPSTANFAHNDRLKVVNDVRGTLLQAVAGLGAIIAAVRTWLVINERGQITERLTRAVEQLANPNLEVRLAAIFALEQIARDSGRDREAIAEILTGYVRTKSPWPPSRPGQYRKEAPPSEVPMLEVRSADVQAAMTVVARGPFAGDPLRPLQLANTDLRRARLIGANLRNADLQGANLESARLYGADLQSAFLWEANLQWASLGQANLLDADLRSAQLQSAHLSGAQLQEAALGRAQLQKADFSDAQLQKADLAEANVEGAWFVGANLQEAEFGDVKANGDTMWPEGFDPATEDIIMDED